MKREESNVKAATYWNLLLGTKDNTGGVEKPLPDLCKDNDLPPDFMKNQNPLDQLIKSKKSLANHPAVQKVMNEEGENQVSSSSNTSLSVADRLVRSKLIKDVFRSSLKSQVNAEDYSQWKRNKELIDKMYNDRQNEFDGGIVDDQSHKMHPTDLSIGQGMGIENADGDATASGTNMSFAPGGAGNERGQGFSIDRNELENVFDLVERDMIKKMEIMELLKDEQLAEKISPSIGIVEQLLHNKDYLPPEALNNAKKIINKYVKEVSEILKTRFDKAVKKVPNPDIVPKRVYRNLDLKRTIWKNLTNFDVEERKLYVDKLYFHRAGKKELPSKIIIIVDQSGSMVEAMVQTVILASIFAELPKVDIELLAFDTRVEDLTKYVRDPLEALLRTNLGGGTYIDLALREAQKKIEDPKRTALVLITDYYEGGCDDALFNTIKEIKDNGTKFVSIASMTNSGYVYVNSHFVNRLKGENIQTVMGNFDKIIESLKEYLK